VNFGAGKKTGQGFPKTWQADTAEVKRVDGSDPETFVLKAMHEGG
jgi:hypothetical protein